MKGAVLANKHGPFFNSLFSDPVKVLTEPKSSNCAGYYILDNSEMWNVCELASVPCDCLDIWTHRPHFCSTYRPLRIQI